MAQNLGLEYLDLQNLRTIDMFSLLLLFEMQRKDFLFLLKIPAVYKLLFTASEGQTQIYWTVTINYGEMTFLFSLDKGN